MKITRIVLVLLAGVLLSAGLAYLAGLGGHDTRADGKHKLLIQVSTDDENVQTIALNNVVNLHNAMVDEIQIEIVAYGPGLSLMMADSPLSKRVSDLALYDNVIFSACGRTLAKREQQTGRKIALSEGVRVVPDGLTRIIELQETGWAYVRP